MKTIIDYKNHSPEQKAEAALKDIENYLGKANMESFEREVKSTKATFRWFEEALGVVGGISGYPVEAWWNNIHPINTEFVKAVFAHANQHYNEDGWDMIVECKSDQEVWNEIVHCTTAEEAIATIGEKAKLWTEQRDSARAEAF